MPNSATVPVTDLRALFGRRENVPRLEPCLEGRLIVIWHSVLGGLGHINGDLTGHLSMALNKKKIRFKCLWEMLCFWVNCENWQPFPAQLPAVLETQRPNPVSHVSSIGCCCLWSWTLSMAHERGTHGSAGANHFLCQQLLNKWASSRGDLEEKTRIGGNVASWDNQTVCHSRITAKY